MVYALQCPHCRAVKVLPEPSDDFSLDAVIDVFVELHHRHLGDGDTIQVVECPVSVKSVSSN
jgi:hypothetical protein